MRTRSQSRRGSGSGQGEEEVTLRSDSQAAAPGPRTPHAVALQSPAHSDRDEGPSDEEDQGSEEEEVYYEYGQDDSTEGSEDEEEEEDSEDQGGRGNPLLRLFSMGGARQALQLPRIPPGYTPPPLEGDLAAELSARSSASHPRHPVPQAPAAKRRLTTAVANPARQLLARECGSDARGGHQSAAQRAHFLGSHRLPSKPAALADTMHSRGYIGQFTRDGELFVAAFQTEKRVKIYDVHRGWKVLKNVSARGLRWTITDTCLSSDQKFLLYASISSTVHLVNVQRGEGAAESIANVTDIHHPLDFAVGEGAYSTGIWSLRWAGDSTEIVAGTADNSLYLFDVAQGRTTVRCEGHQDDVNAVAYADATSQLIFSGSDDCYVKVWDRRIMSSRRSKPAGVLVGHTEGITHIDSKGDGRYLISNGKDQTIKLWDLRRMATPAEAQRWRQDRVPHFSWDYRWMEYPGRGRLVQHPHDGSVMTFRGHSVLSTLIRAYWSPAATTGQRYVYTGSADGGVWVYDVLTGRVVEVLRYHRETVRDCSWHPCLPLLASVSFDGSICLWEAEAPGEAEMDAELAAAKGAARAAAARGGGGKGGGARPGRLPQPGFDQYNGDW